MKKFSEIYVTFTPLLWLSHSRAVVCLLKHDNSLDSRVIVIKTVRTHSFVSGGILSSNYVPSNFFQMTKNGLLGSWYTNYSLPKTLSLLAKTLDYQLSEENIPKRDWLTV